MATKRNRAIGLFIEGVIFLSLATAGFAQPTNDECATAKVVGALPFTDQVNTRLATVGANDPALNCADGGGGKTVWYTFTPSADVFVSINTRGSTPEDYDTALGVFTGTCDNLVEVACNDDIQPGEIRQSEILFAARAGVTYIIHVAEWNGGGPSGGVPTGGDLVFTVQVTTPPPLFQGPASGSIASGDSVNTEDFPLAPSLSRKEIFTHRAMPWREIEPSKGTPKNDLKPFDLMDSNFVRDLAAAPVEINAPVLQTNFPGIPDTGLFIPPDPHMGAGPNHLMATVNSQFGIFDKSGPRLKLIDADAWYATVLPDASPCDPQIVYDHHSGRWIMIWIECGEAPASILLSISDDSDPRGAWCNWRLLGDTNGSTPTELFNDFPKLGVDKDAIYITSNMFSSTAFEYVKLRVIPKAQLLTNSCGAVTWTDFWDLRNPSILNTNTVTTVPAVTFGAPGVEYFVDVDFINAIGNFMNLWSLTNPLSPTPTLTAVTVPVAPFTSPPNADQLGGGTPRIHVGGRVNRNVVYQNGSVWTAHSVADPTGRFARARYVRIDAATGTAAEDVAFGEDNFWYYYPAVHPDGNGNLVMAFTRSGTNEYASARYTGRRASDPPGLTPSALLKAGEENYIKTFGGSRNRWGDYNGIALDPVDNDKVWMFVEYAAKSVGPGERDDRWGTWFGSTTFTPLIGAQILVDPLNINFGVVEADKSSPPFPITISNQGDADLTITSISDPGGGFVLSDLPELPLTLGSFESATFNAAFAPTVGGPDTATIAIASDDSDNPTVRVTLIGEGLFITPAQFEVLYATTGRFSQNSGSLLTINTTTGAGTPIGPTGFIDGVPGLAIDTSGAIYGTVRLTGDLIRIDAATGAGNFVASTGLISVDAIAFDTDNVLYGIDFSPPNFNLYSIDPATGTPTLIGPTGDNFTGLAFDPTTGTLWAATGGSTTAVPDGIFTIDPQTGKATLVGTTGLGGATPDLAVDNEGNLYGVKGGGSEPNVLISIDKSTGKGTVIGPVGFGAVSGLAFRPRKLEGSQIGVSPKLISFGKIRVGQASTARRVTIRSIGTDTLMVTSISDPGTPFELRNLPAFPATLVPGESITFEVTFAPTSVGVFDATITISSDDADNPTQAISLTGEGAVPPPPGTLLASTGRAGNSTLITVNPATGAGTLVGQVAGVGPVTEIDFREDGVLFGTTGGGTSNIITIDVITGAPTLVRNFFNGVINGLEFDLRGTLYGTFLLAPGGPSQLVAINSETGAINLIGQTGFSNIGGLAFSPDSVLYGVTSGPDAPSELLTFNLQTGAATVVGRVTGFFEVSALEFSPEGILYGGLGGQDPRAGSLITIDPATGAGTLVGASGFPAISGLSFVPGVDVRLSIPDTLEAVAGDTVEVPVFMALRHDTVEVAALGAAIKATNNLLSFIDFTPGPIIPGRQFDLKAPAPDSVRMIFVDFGDGPITETGLLATLRFRVDASATRGAKALLKFSELSAADPETDPLSIVGNNGTFTTILLVSIAGKVQYCSPSGGGNPAKPVAEMTALLTQDGKPVKSAQTDVAGNYSLTNIIAGPNYRVTMKRESGGVGVAITTTDALLVFNAFLGNLTLNGCQSLAADVDGNLVIQPIDALRIFNYFLGKISQFPVDAWRAFPASYSIDATPTAWKTAPDRIDYPDLPGDQTNQNFYAVTRGDVDLSWPAASMAILAKRAQNSGSIAETPLQFIVRGSQPSPNTEMIKWEILLDGLALAQGVYAFGAELQYDAAALELIHFRWGEVTPAEGYQLGYNVLSEAASLVEKSTDPANESLSMRDSLGRLRFGGFSTSSAAIREAGVLVAIEMRLKNRHANVGSLPIRLSNVSATVGATTANDGTPNLGKGSAVFETVTVAVSDETTLPAELPTEFALETNYPNPFNPATQIHYQLPEAATVKLEVFNTLGQSVRTLVNSELQGAGFYRVEWNGRNDAGAPAASGIYFYRLEANSASRHFARIRKMVLTK